MSESKSEYGVFDLLDFLIMPSSESADWDRLRAFLREHASGSAAQIAVEEIVTLTKRAHDLLDALCYPPSLPPLVEGGQPQWQISPLDAVARVRGCDEGLDTALPTIMQWKIPEHLKEAR
jgi:hypothetical protein